MGRTISTNRKKRPILYFAIISLILAISSLILVTTLSSSPKVLLISLIILGVTCPLSLLLFFIAYRKGKAPPDIPTKIDFIRSQYKSFRLKDTSKTYVCMVCKRDIEINQDVNNCPNCHSYYHQEHLFQWLQVNTTCPVCGFDYYKNALKTRKTKR